MSVSTLFEKAMKLENSGKYDKALQLFDGLLQNSEYDKGDLLFHCGWCLENLDPNKTKEVLKYYEEAAQITQVPICRMNSQFRCGWLMMHNKDYQVAISYFLNSIELHEATQVDDGLYHQSLYWCAICYEFLGFFIESIKLHQQIQKIAPLLNPESRYREIQCLFKIGSYTEAIQICQTFRDTPPNGFDKIRYQQLRNLTELELESLQDYFPDSFLSRKES